MPFVYVPDMAELGYAGAWGSFSCEALEAPQRRLRVFALFVLADAYSVRGGGLGLPLSRDSEALGAVQDLGDADGHGCAQRSDQQSFRLDAAVGVGLADPHCPGLEEWENRESYQRPAAIGGVPELANADRAELWHKPEPLPRSGDQAEPGHAGEDLADAESLYRQSGQASGERPWGLAGSGFGVWPPGPGGDWSSIPPEFWPVESGLCGVVDGVPTRLQRSVRRARLKALGNSVSPPVAGCAWVVLSALLESSCGPG